MVGALGGAAGAGGCSARSFGHSRFAVADAKASSMFLLEWTFYRFNACGAYWVTECLPDCTYEPRQQVTCCIGLMGVLRVLVGNTSPTFALHQRPSRNAALAHNLCPHQPREAFVRICRCGGDAIHLESNYETGRLCRLVRLRLVPRQALCPPFSYPICGVLDNGR